jgi:hypothetical protein
MLAMRNITRNRTTEMPNEEFARFSRQISVREGRCALAREFRSRNSSNRTGFADKPGIHKTSFYYNGLWVAEGEDRNPTFSS